ncbi:MAG: prepilin-type N-terminal cleavage/methylation domain-containing protein [Geobacteraceae bacterium]|nr:prepilin-type N-terminal cleavage/methylation domain-containing protein [Geobacteraceae bacterium]NTW80798.1 prepilin-type N-terminal cleavage/methylation domain-containing protein [Geobacteraceae bacterium]
MRKYNNKGFSLIELSIVLVIIGIIISAGLKIVGPINQIVKMRETKERLDTAVQSVIGYTASHNSIPNSIATIVSVPRSSWGKDFVYLYDTNFYSAAPTKDTICGRRSSSLTVHTREPDVTTNNVAFAIVSSTEEYAFKSDVGGTVITGSAAITGTLNIDAANSDMVRFVTVDELRTKIGCQGPQLKIVNNELPVGETKADYSATIIADGGVPFATSPSTYKFCVNSNIQASGFAIEGTSGFFSADCLTTVSWGTATPSTGLKIGYSGSPATPFAPSGSYPVTIVVRDNTNGDNQSQKIFVITVNQSP